MTMRGHEIESGNRCVVVNERLEILIRYDVT